MVVVQSTGTTRLRKQRRVRMITGNPLPPPWEYPSRSGLLKARGGLALFTNCLEQAFSETERFEGNKKAGEWEPRPVAID